MAVARRISLYSIVITNDFRRSRYSLGQFHVRSVIRVIKREPDTPVAPAAARG